MDKELLCKGAEMAFKELTNTISNSIIVLSFALIIIAFIFRRKDG